MSRTFLTTTIPYVNAAPHLGFALEAVQADVLARHYRATGDDVRLLSGTDDNSLKNVLAADAAGQDVQAFVDANAARFAALAGPLTLAYDDLIRTSPIRVTAPVSRRSGGPAPPTATSTRPYEGRYCVGCEHYLTADELDPDGHCPDHHVATATASPNTTGSSGSAATPSRSATRSKPASCASSRRRAVTRYSRFLAGGLRDFSVSRIAARARGWGIPVPGDPEQVIYVWLDALGNYVNSLGYGTPASAPTSAPDLATWWTGADRRIHVARQGRRSGSTPSTGRRCCSRPGSPCRPTCSSTTT